MAEITHGISPDDFVARVGRGNVIEDWPFGDASSPEAFTGAYSFASVDAEVPVHMRALALGTVIFGDNTTWLQTRQLYQRDPEFRLYFQTSPEEQTALEQIAGVNVALAVELGSHTATSVPGREARIIRVLGIEQPLTVPDASGLYPKTGRIRNIGFIQGTIVNELPEEELSRRYNSQIILGRPYPGEAILAYPFIDLHSREGQVENASPQNGDRIRTRVERFIDDRKNTFSPSLPRTMFVYNRDVTRTK